MQMWEYKVIDAIGRSELNSLGAKGWELCAITPIGPRFIFKRPIGPGKGCPPEPTPPMSLDEVVELLNKGRGK